MTALSLLDKGYRVTIPLTSQIAGALWEYPPGGCGITEIETPLFGCSTLEQYWEWALQSFEFYRLMADRDELIGDGLERAAGAGKFGAKMKTLFQFFQQPIEDDFPSPMIDTDVAMAFLMRLVQSKGVVLEAREIIGDLRLHEQELLSDYHADIIVNASGIGARELATDSQIFPVRGAVKKIRRPEGYPADHAFLLPAQMNHDGSVSKTAFIVPRSDDTLVVGSITQRNNWQLNLSPDSPDVKAMWERTTEFLPSLAQGLRPLSHLNVRDSADSRANTCRIVHNYGHGGSGWTLAVGCARTCVRLVEEILDTGRSANAEVCRL
ncbi:hypothetical protein BDV30DRAFT_227289 [Aspergillus minisclerotigenes]|uniref:FAD dependent oxidoreductase domain-containing protein n=1 Tax=Aspergillus minisclerotigenes TaxID=656917 RepID=A0A5N6J393_9EURO|nr:hypothetical protein BDV30DRAFT_227289 [Aspergillus minisclerotigenes]